MESWNIYEFESAWNPHQGARCAYVLWASGTSKQDAIERLFRSAKIKDLGENTQKNLKENLVVIKVVPLGDFADIMGL